MASSAAPDGFPDTGFPILNPLAHTAYLPPDIGRQTAVAGHIIVGTLAILIWDVINNLSEDWKLVTRYRIRLPTVTYFLSRFCSLIYVCWSSIYYTGPIGNCFKNEKGLGAFYPASVSLSALLFFFRVRIVYEGKKWVVISFFLFWLCVVGGTLTVGFGVVGQNIGPTDYCINAKVEAYIGAAAIIPLVYDTSVFLAITYRLAATSHIAVHKKRGLWETFKGDYLPGVSRALLKDGQAYYMVTVFSNLLTVVMIYMSSLPVTYRTIFSAPNVMLINIMACRVFRHTKFGVFSQSMFTNGSVLATNIKNAAMLPVAFRHTVTGQQETRADTVTLTRGGSYSYKAPTTPNSGISDTKGPVEQTPHREEHIEYPPNAYPPQPRKDPTSETPNRF